MDKNPSQYQEEIDLREIFKAISNFFKSVLKYLLKLILFYTKRWILFLSVVIIGVIAGYFLDKQMNISTSFIQEVIIQPKYGMQKYLYDYINNFGLKLDNENFLSQLELSTDDLHALKGIEIVPIVRPEEIVSEFYEKYGDKDYYHHFLEDNKFADLDKEKYLSFYKEHKIVFSFKIDSESNSKVVDAVLKGITQNQYYKKVLALEQKQSLQNLEESKQTIKFIDDYLKKVNDSDQIQKDKEVVVVKESSEIQTIGSLLNQKNSLLEKVDKYEKALLMDKELIEIVDKGILVPHKKILISFLFIIPFLLFWIVSIFLMRKSIVDKMIQIIND